ncbi:MAG: glycosyltransferase family 9 protein, partial [bacterium]|nr:glycosyltransferase family 9 protein [bacterium]
RMFPPAGPSVALRESFADCQLLVASVPRGTQAPDIYLRNLRSLCGNLRIGDPLPETGQTRHMVERLLDPLRKDCVPPSCLTPSIPLPSVLPREQLIVLHPGSGGRSKCWPPAEFAALLAYLQGRGHRTEILWGPAEEARRDEFPPSLSDPAVLRAPLTPWALANYLASAQLYIGNDTGPGHVAAAVGCPTVSLFGPTDPNLWRPLGPSGYVLQAPDGNLASLSLSQVIAAVDIALG